VPVEPESEDELRFGQALDALLRQLALLIVTDGEGARRIGRVVVRGGDAKGVERVARAIANSPLVKTALHGGDPNWGRILAAVGRSGARFSLKKISLHAATIALVLNGEPAPYREKDAAKVFARERVPLRVNLGGGNASAVVLSCDLGHDYVSLNADYRS